MNTMDQIKVRYGEEGKLVPIQEFLKTKNLSGITLKIQESLKDLYQLNGDNNPPLFHFPKFPEDKPLIIDCTTPTDDDCMAHYINGEHVVEFVRNLHNNPHIENSTFTGLLAHELSHAEVDIAECHNLAKNGKQFAQKELINEATAFAKEHMIEAMLNGNQKAYSDSERIDAVKSELEWLIHSDYYRYRWDSSYPMKNNDQPLTSIPEIFHIPSDLLSSIQTLPELVPFDFYKKIEERPWTYLREHSEDVTNFLKNRKPVSTDITRLLQKIIFNKGNSSDKDSYKDLRMMHFLLQCHGKDGTTPLLDEDSIKRIFLFNSQQNGTTDSKFLKLMESKVDHNGNRIFPDDFAKKAQNMTLSEFTTCFDHFFDFAGWYPLCDKPSKLKSVLGKHASQNEKGTVHQTNIPFANARNNPHSDR